ncbi:hypothetical protein EAI_02487, partial [Harpegnathos saltator]
RSSISQACLDRFKRNKMGFKRRFVTVDETCIRHYTTRAKEITSEIT